MLQGNTYRTYLTYFTYHTYLTHPYLKKEKTKKVTSNKKH